MPRYLISYDLRKVRNYQPLYDCMAQWKAARILESVWVADLTGPAAAVRDALRTLVDSDDGLVVVALARGFNWAAYSIQPAGSNWLKAHSP